MMKSEDRELKKASLLTKPIQILRTTQPLSFNGCLVLKDDAAITDQAHAAAQISKIQFIDANQASYFHQKYDPHLILWCKLWKKERRKLFRSTPTKKQGVYLSPGLDNRVANRVLTVKQLIEPILQILRETNFKVKITKRKVGVQPLFWRIKINFDAIV